MPQQHAARRTPTHMGLRLVRCFKKFLALLDRTHTIRGPLGNQDKLQLVTEAEHWRHIVRQALLMQVCQELLRPACTRLECSSTPPGIQGAQHAHRRCLTCTI